LTHTHTLRLHTVHDYGRITLHLHVLHVPHAHVALRFTLHHAPHGFGTTAHTLGCYHAHSSTPAPLVPHTFTTLPPGPSSYHSSLDYGFTRLRLHRFYHTPPRLWVYTTLHTHTYCMHTRVQLHTVHHTLPVAVTPLFTHRTCHHCLHTPHSSGLGLHRTPHTGSTTWVTRLRFTHTPHCRTQRYVYTLHTFTFTTLHTRFTVTHTFTIYTRYVTFAARILRFTAAPHTVLPRFTPGPAAARMHARFTAVGFCPLPTHAFTRILGSGFTCTDHATGLPHLPHVTTTPRLHTLPLTHHTCHTHTATTTHTLHCLQFTHTPHVCHTHLTTRSSFGYTHCTQLGLHGCTPGFCTVHTGYTRSSRSVTFTRLHTFTFYVTFPFTTTTRVLAHHTAVTRLPHYTPHHHTTPAYTAAHTCYTPGSLPAVHHYYTLPPAHTHTPHHHGSPTTHTHTRVCTACTSWVTIQVLPHAGFATVYTHTYARLRYTPFGWIALPAYHLIRWGLHARCLRFCRSPHRALAHSLPPASHTVLHCRFCLRYCTRFGPVAYHLYTRCYGYTPRLGYGLRAGSHTPFPHTPGPHTPGYHCGWFARRTRGFAHGHTPGLPACTPTDSAGRLHTVCAHCTHAVHAGLGSALLRLPGC